MRSASALHAYEAGPNYSYTYDAEDRITSMSGATTGTYTYAGDNRRITRDVSGTLYTYIYYGTNVIAEYLNNSGAATPGGEFFYFGGKLMGRFANGSTWYYHEDHLSVRVTTDSTGASVGDRGHRPYGDQWYDNGIYTKWAFTTYKRDSDESFNDYAINRYYSNRLGRFLQSDKLNQAYTNPQLLNRYAYVGDDPVNATDSLGLEDLPCDPGVEAQNCVTVTADPGPGIDLEFADPFGGGAPQIPPEFGVGDGLGGDGPGRSPRTPNRTPLPPRAQTCENKIQGAVNNALNTNTTYLGPTVGPGINDVGFRNGAYNFNYFAPDIVLTNSVPGSIGGSGRFPGSGLHIPLPGGKDPTIQPWGYDPTAGGSYFTAHFDSANPLDDLVSFFEHRIGDVLLRRPHGC